MVVGCIRQIHFREGRGCLSRDNVTRKLNIRLSLLQIRKLAGGWVYSGVQGFSEMALC